MSTWACPSLCAVLLVAVMFLPKPSIGAAPNDGFTAIPRVGQPKATLGAHYNSEAQFASPQALLRSQPALLGVVLDRGAKFTRSLRRHDISVVKESKIPSPTHGSPPQRTVQFSVRQYQSCGLVLVIVGSVIAALGALSRLSSAWGSLRMPDSAETKQMVVVFAAVTGKRTVPAEEVPLEVCGVDSGQLEWQGKEVV